MKRLGDVIVRAQARGLDGGFDRAVLREHHHRDLRMIGRAMRFRSSSPPSCGTFRSVITMSTGRLLQQLQRFFVGGRRVDFEPASRRRCRGTTLVSRPRRPRSKSKNLCRWFWSWRAWLRHARKFPPRLKQEVGQKTCPNSLLENRFARGIMAGVYQNGNYVNR